VLPLVTPSDQVEDGLMISVHCPRHGSEKLLTERHITGLERSADGLTVRWVCWCGHHGSHRTGRPRKLTAII